MTGSCRSGAGGELTAAARRLPLLPPKPLACAGAAARAAVALPDALGAATVTNDATLTCPLPAARGGVGGEGEGGCGCGGPGDGGGGGGGITLSTKEHGSGEGTRLHVAKATGAAPLLLDSAGIASVRAAERLQLPASTAATSPDAASGSARTSASRPKRGRDSSRCASSAPSGSGSGSAPPLRPSAVDSTATTPAEQTAGGVRR